MKSLIAAMFGLVLISVIIVSPPVCLANNNTMTNETILNGNVITAQPADFDVGASYVTNNFAPTDLSASPTATMRAAPKLAAKNFVYTTPNATADNNNPYVLGNAIEVAAVARNGSSMDQLSFLANRNAIRCEPFAREVAYNIIKPMQASASVIDAMEPKTKTKTG